ncbi:MAG TPA: hypothetical protein VNN22_08025 [Verrucomicrobiae bacterium]|nr:hypothetical protein [Verrucomicrobiae bacterium]
MKLVITMLVTLSAALLSGCATPQPEPLRVEAAVKKFWPDARVLQPVGGTNGGANRTALVSHHGGVYRITYRADWFSAQTTHTKFSTANITIQSIELERQ